MKKVGIVMLLCLACLTLGNLGAQAQRMKAWYKVSRLSVSEVGVTCLNGADPTGKTFGKTLVLSCGDKPPLEPTSAELGE